MSSPASAHSSIVATHRLTPEGPSGYLALIAAAIVSALAIVLAFPPVSIWLAIFFAPAALAWLALTAPSTRSALLITLIVQLALWLWMGRWLPQVTAVGYPFYALYLALYPALFVWIIRRLHRDTSPNLIASLPLTITVPIVWVGLETLRGELAFNGYPWFLLAHPLIDAPQLVQSADLFGTYFISFLAAMISGALLDVLRYRERRIEAGAVVPIVAGVIIIHAANMAYGYWRMAQTEPLEAGPTLLSIQTNMPQDNKLRATVEERIEFMNEFLQLTAHAYMRAAEEDLAPDLVIWPETMAFGYGFEPVTLEFLIERDFFPGDMLYRELRRFVEQAGIPMLIGSPAYIGLDVDEERRSDWDQLYNSAYLIEGPPPHQRYDKYFLTPFGETMPYISSWPWLEQRLLALGARGMTFDLDAGTSYDRLTMSWNGRAVHLATPICFEVTMSRTCRMLVGPTADDRADILINLSNDGWFGWYEAGRIQHAQIARFRSIEHRIPMVRSVNTGLSIAIDSRGGISGKLGDGPYGECRQPGALLTTVMLDARQTLYTMIGNAFAWLMLLLTVLAVAMTYDRRQGAAGQ